MRGDRKYLFTLPGQATQEYSPINTGSISIVGKLESEQIFIREKLSDGLILDGAGYSDMMSVVYPYYESGECCEIEVEIQEKDGANFQRIYKGYASLYSLSWDHDRCTVKLSTVPDDLYRCWDRNKKTKYNISALAKTLVDCPVKTVFEFIVKLDLSDILPAEAGNGWQKIFHSITRGRGIWAREVMLYPESESYPFTWTPSTEDYEKNLNPQAIYSINAWANRVFPPSGYVKLVRGTSQQYPTGFVDSDFVITNNTNPVQELGTSFSFSGNIYILAVQYQGFPGSSGYNNVGIKLSKYQGFFLTETFTYNRGVNLITAIQEVASQVFDDCFPSITVDNSFFLEESLFGTDFFNDYRNVVIYQKSDIKRFTSSEAARFEISIDDLTEFLLSLELRWSINESGVIKIDHISRYQNRIPANSQDLTSTHPTNIKGFNRVEYAIDELPISETILWMESGESAEWVNRLNYLPCSRVTSSDDKVYQAGNWLTDISHLHTRPDLISDSGYVALACHHTPNGFLRFDVITYFGELVNYPLSTYFILTQMWKANRPQQRGFMNGGMDVELVRSFQATSPEISIQGLYTTLKKIGMITTYAGIGVIQEWNYRLKDGRMKYKINY